MNEFVQWFGWANITALAAFVLSLVACIGAAFAWVKSHNVQKRQVEIEEKRERDRLIEKSRARLVAQIVPEEGRLRITNTGLAEARDIILTMDGKPVLEHPAIPHGVQDFHLLGPGSSAEVPLAISLECQPPWQVKVVWNDDSGEPGHYRTTVT